MLKYYHKRKPVYAINKLSNGIEIRTVCQKCGTRHDYRLTITEFEDDIQALEGKDMFRFCRECMTSYNIDHQFFLDFLSGKEHGDFHEKERKVNFSFLDPSNHH